MIENLKTTLLLVAFMLFCMVTQAQNVTVQGTVTDSQDEPIIGATLRVKNSKAGAVTDLDGKFKLENVRQGSEIEVSSIGFVSQTVKASAQTMTIKLTEDKKLLDEVVVVGYGTLKTQLSQVNFPRSNSAYSCTNIACRCEFPQMASRISSL